MGGGKGNGKRRWFISFSRSSTPKTNSTAPPKEFLCPISGSLMFDPVVVTTGQTFERLSVHVCNHLSFSPLLPDGSHPDFSTVIPNLTLKSTILSWCKTSGAPIPSSPEYVSVQKAVQSMFGGPIRVSERDLLKAVAENPPPLTHTHAVSELTHRVTDRFCSSSSEESVIVARSPGTPLTLKTRPFCYSSSSSLSEFYDFESPSWTPSPNPNPTAAPSPEEDELVSKLNSTDIFEHEKAVSYLRKTTKHNSESRAALCTPRLLSALKHHLVSRYSSIQVNAVASVVNLSLEPPNRVKIVRSGIIPYLIDVLKGGSPECQNHAAGAMFSLSIAQDNKMAIGALGALQPLLHALRSDNEQTSQDSALALYHLTLVSSNRVKLVNLNAVPNLLDMVGCGNLGSKVLLVLCNLAACNEGRVAILDANGVHVLVELLRGIGEESTRENCVSALYSLSQGNYRFKLLLGKAKGVEVLREVEQKGGDRAKEKAMRLLEMMRLGDDGDGEGIDWEAFLASGEVRRTRRLPSSGNFSAKSTEF